MASAAEQLAANINFGAFAKAEELKARIWFTLGALIVARIGTYIPLPGIDAAAFAQIFAQHSGGVLGMVDMFNGGAISRMTVFALGIMPYISASIIMQLLTSVSPHLEALKKEGDAGRKKINQYTRYGAVVLAMVQAFGMANGLQSMSGPSGSAVIDPGIFFVITTVVTLTGGTMFLMWLGEQITARGIGNGISLIIFAGIVALLPSACGQLLAQLWEGTVSGFKVTLIAVLAVVVITGIVFFERAQRRLIVQYPKRQVGNRMFGGESSHLPLKLNASGVIPPIFASSLLLLPLTVAGFYGTNADTPGWLQGVMAHFGHGQPIYIVAYIGLIVFFAFFYTAIVFNPDDTAENLKKHGGFLPGIRPGKNTAEYLDYVLTRLTVIGAAYLAVVCAMPEILIANYALPFYFGGTSLLIVVSVTMDTVAQIHSHLLAHQYEGLLKKSKLKGRR
ncbi:protein translocase subunit secY/sec61 alpha [Dongia mobilis]|uniref:Protein translocase subunit SecY n=1 Tax=Dongia mobilis TaxID=578943 RepID=A0A4R6X040_9PROT|nr:preprotein translocase subunit SecY [Dongia mobilis]TDQ83798.1 protein translocase subunit secY/sec61 alpha [Dongia mobilis]